MYSTVARAVGRSLVPTLFLLAGAGGAQAQLALEMEGPITNYENSPGVRPTLEVMGVPVTVERNTSLISPTTSRDDLGISVNQWFRGPRFDGRNDRGFLGGTATVVGTVTEDGAITAEEIFAEPAENVVLGVISVGDCSTPTCGAPGDSIRFLVPPLSAGPEDGVLALPIQDPRMAFSAPVGEFGFELNLAGADLAGFEASVEGYYGDFSVTGATKPELHFFALEISDGGLLLASPEAYEVAGTRAQCRQRDVNEWEIEVRGSTHVPLSQDGVADPASGVIGMQDQDGAPIALDEVAVIDALAEAGDPNIFGGFRVRIDERAGVCPTSVILTWTGADGLAGTALSEPFEVEIRDDTAG